MDKSCVELLAGAHTAIFKTNPKLITIDRIP